VKKRNLFEELSEVVKSELGRVNEIIDKGEKNLVLDFSAITDIDETKSGYSFVSNQTHSILQSRRNRGIKSSFNNRYKKFKKIQSFASFKK
jgi:hypothetical protein